MASSSRRTGGKESFHLRKKFEPHLLRDSEMPRSPPPNPSASRLAFTADPEPRVQEVLSKSTFLLGSNVKRGLGDTFLLAHLGQEEVERDLGNSTSPERRDGAFVKGSVVGCFVQHGPLPKDQKCGPNR
jgi:hypothetical protein